MFVALQQGHIEYFGVEEWRTSVRFKHSCGVVGVYCDIGGARACVADARRRLHVYCPAADELCAVPNARDSPAELRLAHSPSSV